MNMIRVFRLLAFLAVVTLAVSGGLYTHASEAHEHHPSDLSTNKDGVDHQHAQSGYDASGKELSLHCGAFILTLPAETSFAMPTMATYMPGHIEPAHRPAQLLFDTPPPRLFS